MPDWILLLPLLFPLIAVIAFALAAPRVPASARRWLPHGLLLTEILLVALNILPGSHRLTLSGWNLAAYSVALQMDGTTLLLLLVILVSTLGLRMIAPARRPLGLFPVLVVIASMLLAASANLITAYLAWVLLDLALFAWRIRFDIEKDTAIRTLAVGQVAALCLFAGAIVAGADAATGTLLIALALWGRLALFPFQWTLPSHGEDTSDLWIARSVPAIAAANLWLHWQELQAAAPAALIGPLAGAAMTAGAIWIWREERPTRAASVGAAHSLAFVPLAIAYGGRAGAALALWLLLGVAVSVLLFQAAVQWEAENARRYPRLIWLGGLVSLTALPLTPAFLGRLGLYVVLWESGEWLLLVVAAVTTWLVLAPLWNIGLALRGSENRKPSMLENAGLLVLSLVFAALALAPILFANALGAAASDSAEQVIDRVIRTDDAVAVVVAIAMLLLPVVGSYLTRRVADAFQVRPGSPSARLAKLIDLEWLERVVTVAGYQVGALARGTATIAEENPTVWILLAGLWVAIVVSILR